MYDLLVSGVILLLMSTVSDYSSFNANRITHWIFYITLIRKISSIPANTKRSAYVGTMLDQRRRRCANIVPTLGERFVFAGILIETAYHSMSQHIVKKIRNIEPMLVQCWADVADGRPTLNEHRLVY